ncbi:hypothetical protein [Nocardia sp. NPDC050710]|uniref:hypothetical protein n=1 Tax=Nocardia sp. NPDC050710 TaxID=3157220 RepID=UPI0033C24800
MAEPLKDEAPLDIRTLTGSTRLFAAVTLALLAGLGVALVCEIVPSQSLRIRNDSATAHGHDVVDVVDA